MLKKIFCLIFAALILMTGSAFANEHHLQIKLTVHQNEDESFLSADAFFCNNEILILSSLFPSYYLSLKEDTGRMIPELSQGISFNSFSIPPIRNALAELIRMMNLSESEGVYTGDLFDGASVQAAGSFTMEELLALPEEVFDAKGENWIFFIKPLIGEIKNQLEQKGLIKSVVRFGVYDNGKYLTITGISDEKTIFTLSCDFADPNAVKAVFGRSENGTNYYWVSDFNVLSENEIRYTCRLLADGKKQGFRSVMNCTPVLTENWKISLSENREEMSFSGEILPGNEMSPADITGYLSLEKYTFQAQIGFRNMEGTCLNISSVLDESPVHTEGLKAFSMDNLSDLPDIGTITSEISRNMMPFMLQLIQLLPEEYMTLLFSLN